MSTVLNIDKCSLCQGTPDCSVLGKRFQLFHRDTKMFDRLFDQILVSPPWAALVPMTLWEDSIEELIWYMRVIPLDHMACTVKPCFEDHGLNDS